MKDTVQNQVKSAAEIADERKKEEERKKREEAAERERIKKQAAAIACNYVRIGGTWYKECTNVWGESVLERYPAANMDEDFGRKLGTAIREAAPKCINSVCEPEHVKYQRFIESPSKDVYYNKYMPLKYKPKEGEWPHIEQLLRHIFGEQYDLGLDYLEVMYIYPKRRLPILVLVSKENGTGKSTFCNFLREIYGKNAMAITVDTIGNQFNSEWATKNLVYVEEALIEKTALLEKIKSYSTAMELPTEQKGRDITSQRTYLKMIMCSNDELRPTIITKEDTRHWVRKVPIISDNTGNGFLGECVDEIPAFLYALTKRQLTTEGKDRLWFSHEETETEAWRKIVENSRKQDELELTEYLNHIISEVGHSVSYSISELVSVLKDKNTKIVSEKIKRDISSVRLKEIFRGWGLYESKLKKHKVYYFSDEGKVVSRNNVTGRIFTFSNELSFLHDF